jgi:hypothetical protein
MEQLVIALRKLKEAARRLPMSVRLPMKPSRSRIRWTGKTSNDSFKESTPDTGFYLTGLIPQLANTGARPRRF